MAKKKVQLTELEAKFIEAIRERPQMKERFEAILAMSQSSEGKIKTADEIEAALILEVQKLGAITMKEWAAGAEQASGQAHQKENPGSHCTKKND